MENPMLSAATFLFLSTMIINQVIPPDNTIPVITLPDNQTITTNTATIKITATTEGKKVKWIVFNSRFDTPVSFDNIDDKSIRLYINRVEDVIIIFAYTSVNNNLSDPAKTVIQVTLPLQKEFAPTPTKEIPVPKEAQKEPAPAPAPKVILGHLTFIIDSSSSIQSALVNNNNLRKHLSDNGVKLYVIDAKSKAAEGIAPAVKLITGGKTTGVSTIVLQDNTTAANAIDGMIITSSTTIDEVMALIRPYTLSK